MPRVYQRASAMNGSSPAPVFEASANVGANVAGASAQASTHLTMTVVVGVALLAVVIFLPKVL